MQKKNGKLVGMLIQDGGDWGLYLGSSRTMLLGRSQQRQECIEICLQLGYEFFVEEFRNYNTNLSFGNK